MLKSDKSTSKTENYRPISLMNINEKNPQQNNGKSNPTTYQKDHLPWPSKHPRDAGVVQLMQMNKCNAAH
jgi:hypothetical protein